MMTLKCCKLISAPGLIAAMCAGFAALAAHPAWSQQDSEIGPDYADAPETLVNPAVPHGAIHELLMDSADSSIYPGIVRIESDITARRDAFGNRIAAPAEQISAPGPYQRHVWVYVPQQYVPGRPAPFMVVQDGHGYLPRMPVVLDNLIAAHRLPAMILVMVDSGGSDAQGSERGLEYDTISDRYTRFIESEVLPRAAKECNVVFTKDPAGRASMGGSSGGVAAFTMAWFHPELYHKVLTYSGTYVNQASPVDPKTPRGGWEYHDHLIAAAPAKPIRIWMEVGEKDLHYDDPESTWHNWPLANQRMAAVLKAKGYDYRFVYAKDAKHVDARVVAQTLPGALEWLWRDYR
ncbi:MAG: alpha/beta hydrolase-fold protein [Steroidobacteraceae bacterium]|jgi:enterochelin esterase-like enzyme